MAEPNLFASLLTPNSIHLTWRYGGSADFEVFWKSDHPAGQEYARLATTSALTYDVPNLSWTTTYYFKVRAVSGATYGAFSNEVYIFVCCGQAVLNRDTPSNRVSTSWQQSLDVKPDGSVAFVTIAREGETVATYLWDSINEWSYFAEFYTTSDATEPFSVRYVGDKVCYYPFIFYYAEFWTYKLLELVAYQDLHGGWNGPILGPWPGGGGDVVYFSIEGLAVNDDGRVVLIMYKPSANPTFYSVVSYDWGVTFADIIPIITPFTDDTGDIGRYPYTLASYREGPDGAIWIANVSNHVDWPSQVDQVDIWKYIVGEEPTLITTFGTDVSEWMNNMLLIAVEEDKIGVYCVNEKYASPVDEIPSLGISTDYGSNWAVKPISWVKTGKRASAITIADGNIILFSQRASDNANCIYRSTDDGDTWTEVYVFDSATWYLPHYDFSVLESSGQYVGFTSCALTLEPEADHNTGFLWSTDAGLTWAWIETPDYISYTQILVPV